MYHFVLAASLVLSPVSDNPLSGGFKSGNDVLAECSRQDGLNLGQCIGYLEGVADAMELTRATHELPLCIPKAVQASQLRDVVIGFLQTNADIRHYSANALVWGAFVDAWCPQLKGK